MTLSGKKIKISGRVGNFDGIHFAAFSNPLRYAIMQRKYGKQKRQRIRAEFTLAVINNQAKHIKHGLAFEARHHTIDYQFSPLPQSVTPMITIFTIIFIGSLAGGAAWAYFKHLTVFGYIISLSVAGFIGSSIIALVFCYLYFYPTAPDPNVSSTPGSTQALPHADAKEIEQKK